MKIEAGSEALQQIAQSQEGLVDHVDIVDDGACTGEDAGNGVEHLTDIQEAVVSVAGTTVQIDHFLFADGGIVAGSFIVDMEIFLSIDKIDTVCGKT